jgi:hypothetical protein
MRYWLLILLVLVAGLIAVAGYALVQPLQTPQQTIGKAAQQAAERILMLNISVDSAEFQSNRRERGNGRGPPGVLRRTTV